MSIAMPSRILVENVVPGEVWNPADWQVIQDDIWTRFGPDSWVEAWANNPNFPVDVIHWQAAIIAANKADQVYRDQVEADFDAQGISKFDRERKRFRSSFSILASYAGARARMAYVQNNVFWHKFEAQWGNISPILVPGAFLMPMRQVIEGKQYEIFTVLGGNDTNVADLISAGLTGVRINTSSMSADNHLALFNAGYSVYSEGWMETVKEPWVTRSGRVRNGGSFMFHPARHTTMMRPEHEVQP